MENIVTLVMVYRRKTHTIMTNTIYIYCRIYCVTASMTDNYLFGTLNYGAMAERGNRYRSGSFTLNSVSRRQVLKAIAGSAGVVLAGCAEKPTPSNSTGSGGDLEKSKKHVFVTGGNIPSPINNYNYNIFSNRYRSDLSELFFGFRDHHNEKYVSEVIGGALTDWQYNRGDKATLMLKKGLVWQDGSPHTAEDIVVGFKLLKEYLGESSGIWNVADGVSANGKWTVEIDLGTDYSRDIFLASIFGEGTAAEIPTNTRADVHGKYLEMLQDASSESKKSKAIKELEQLSITDYPPKTGATAWKPVNHTDTYVEFERFDEHPYAENINWKRTRMISEDAKNEHGLQYLKAGKLDLLKATVSKSVRKTFPESIETDNIPKPQLTTLLFNNQHELLGRRKVRQAFAYLLDRPTLANIVFPPAPNPLKHLVGFGPTAEDKWLEGIRDKLIPYDTDKKKATKLLQEEGFTKEGETWMTHQGDPFSLQFMMIKFPNLAKTVKAIDPQLNQFGIETNVISKSPEFMWSGPYPNAEYEITVGPSGGMGEPHPYVSLDRVFNDEVAPSIASKTEYSYPMPIGDLNGSMKRANVMDLVSKIPTASEQKAIELVQELAWAFNYNIPQLSIMRRTQQTQYDTAGWKIPSFDTLGMTQSRTNKTVMQNGLIARQKK